MSEKRKRPAAVWGTQIFLTLYILFFLFAFFWVITTLIGSSGGPFPLGIVFGCVIFLLILIALISSWVGMILNRVWGRWMSVATLGLLTLMVTLGQINRLIQELPSLPPGMRGGYLFGTLIPSVILLGIPAYLVYRLIVSEEVKDFFEPRVVASPPPPPPMFDEEMN